MIDEIDFAEIVPKAATSVPTAAQISRGIPVPPARLLQVMSSDEWEAFTEECLSFYRDQGDYETIRKYSGPGDLGLDVVAFTSSTGFEKPWDSFQCKYYDHPLEPNDIYGEIGKIIYHSYKRTPPFNQTCRVPRRHLFVAPYGVGITVGRWLKDPHRLKAEVLAKWETHCVPKIGSKIRAPLESEFLAYFNDFDFSIFGDKSSVELIELHAKTVFYAPRFGGGLPPRDQPSAPPTEPTQTESMYLRKILDSYADHLREQISATHDLDSHPELKSHYDRQRVLFYSAEALRNFARDRTPPLTFASLQDDVYHGVVDSFEREYPSGFERLRSTVTTAGAMDVSGNALVSVTRTADKQGICHQLANDNRLTWVK